MSQRAHDIVPEGFELADVHYTHSSTPAADRKRCPECRKISIVRRAPGLQNGRWDCEHKWRCDKCGHTFDEPLPPESEVDSDE